MKKGFSNIVLMGREHVEGVAEALLALIDLLQARQVSIALEKDTASLLPKQDLPVVAGNELGKQCDLIIVVGGDGSLLNAARIAAKQNLPVVGINRGRLGFLTDIPPNQIEQIGHVLDGDYIEESRFLLTTDIHQNGKKTTHSESLNDVVLLPGDIAHMIEFEILIDKQFVCHHKADGLIVATPTGSTAYALSGGGPILHPQLDAIVIVPMFPHTLSSRPIVVEGGSDIEIVISENNKTSPKVSCDGQKHVTIAPGGKIHVRKQAEMLRLIHPSDYHYFETLRAKLHWESK